MRYAPRELMVSLHGELSWTDAKVAHIMAASLARKACAYLEHSQRGVSGVVYILVDLL